MKKFLYLGLSYVVMVAIPCFGLFFPVLLNTKSIQSSFQSTFDYPIFLSGFVLLVALLGYSSYKLFREGLFFSSLLSRIMSPILGAIFPTIFYLSLTSSSMGWLVGYLEALVWISTFLFFVFSLPFVFSTTFSLFSEKRYILTFFYILLLVVVIFFVLYISSFIAFFE